LVIALEVYIINKQKFLAELGRLLTFMYEEDRQTALSMYNRLFDMTDNEQALLQFLVSPTRQAVVLARTYDAAERKLQVRSQHRDPAQAASADTPPFVLAIEKLEQEALSLGVTAPAVNTDQLSLFEDAVPAEEDDAPAAEDEFPAVKDELPPPQKTEADDLFSLDSVDGELGSTAARAAEADVRFTLDTVTDEPEAPAQTEPVLTETFSEEPSSQPAPAEEAAEEAAAPAPADDEPAPAEDAEEDAPAKAELPEAPEPAQSAPVDKVDAFLSDFSIKDDTSAASAEPSPAAVPPAPGRQAELAVDVPALDSSLPFAPVNTVRKPRVALLIVYIILAIPVGLAAVALLLIPTLFSLSFAFSFGVCAFALMGSAFSSFAMFADILAVFGVSLILFALALLFAWLFFWLIGGAICGLVRGLCRLGGKWCYKEVPAV